MITLNDYLYSGDTIFRVLQNYITDLREDARKTKNEIDLIHCNFLIQIRELLEHNEFLTTQSQQIREFYKYMTKEYPYLAFTVKGRIKSLIRAEEKFNGYIVKYISDSQPDEYQSLHITFYDNCSRSYIEVQIRTKQMDDIAEIGPANHLGYEKKQEKERVRRNAIPRGECIYFDEAYERGMKLLGLDLAKLDVNMFAAMNNSLINDGCGLFRGRLILPYEHLSRFQNDLID